MLHTLQAWHQLFFKTYLSVKEHLLLWTHIHAANVGGTFPMCRRVVFAGFLHAEDATLDCVIKGNCVARTLRAICQVHILPAQLI